MKFALIFATQSAPLLVMAVLFALFWVVIKRLLLENRRSGRHFLRQQTLWSNWS